MPRSPRRLRKSARSDTRSAVLKRSQCARATLCLGHAPPTGQRIALRHRRVRGLPCQRRAIPAAPAIGEAGFRAQSRPPPRRSVGRRPAADLDKPLHNRAESAGKSAIRATRRIAIPVSGLIRASQGMNAARRQESCESRVAGMTGSALGLASACFRANSIAPGSLRCARNARRRSCRRRRTPVEMRQGECEKRQRVGATASTSTAPPEAP